MLFLKPSRGIESLQDIRFGKDISFLEKRGEKIHLQKPETNNKTFEFKKNLVEKCSAFALREALDLAPSIPFSVTLFFVLQVDKFGGFSYHGLQHTHVICKLLIITQIFRGYLFVT